ncbi:hypothetical protein BACPEC_00570 [[Bacteroides] pectinophilus ATCC 43243]|uniref:Uncharacterized protein n=1 Tax=[Bacteroides] pectinophilus ATCC 43243 TaxID=483218 RepID=B7APG4_9FIRM|nr:hypothetical protein BACPEC_00570 [[Bacteroides] pectinophilus ATCC 43243]
MISYIINALYACYRHSVNYTRIQRTSQDIITLIDFLIFLSYHM